MKIITLILAAAFCSISFGQEIALESFATGFNDPVNISSAGDSRLFVVERAGLIQVLNSDGVVNSTPFLDINHIVNDGGGERGLLGLAFHPNYLSNGHFYVNYVNNAGNTVISRFTRSSNNLNTGDENSELQLLSITQPFANHNGGNMAFGPDGYLYISSGDGGDGGDPGNRAQSLTTLLGKILRIDVDGSDRGNYGIPPSNPYAGSSTNMQEIWAYGLRNPWKFSFDRTTGDLWIADVGQNVLEEINMVPSTAAGLNYGWRCYEGNLPYDQSANCPPNGDLTFPIAQYTHDDDGAFKCSITGGYFYRGTAQPGLVGLYLFADFCSDEIGVLRQSGDDWNMTFTPAFEGNGWTTFGEDNNGELYIAGISSGTVYKIVGSSLGIDEKDSFSVKLFPNPTKNEITLNTENTTELIESVNIYSMEGKLISSNSDFQTQLITISTKNLTSGMYLVEIKSAMGNSLIKKLIKI